MGLFDDLFAVVNEIKSVGSEFTDEVMGLKDEVAKPIADIQQQATESMQSIGETVNQAKDAKDQAINRVNKLVQ